MKVADLRLSPQTVELLERLSEKLNVSQSAVIETAVSRMAAQEDVGRAGDSGEETSFLDELREEIAREAGESERKED